MEQKVFFTNSKGSKLCGILSNPSENTKNPIVIMVHGSNSSKNTESYVMLQKVLNYKNISTFRIDLFAHGESEGNFEDLTVSEAVDDILNAIIFLKSTGYKKVALVGSSFGGLASIIAASISQNLLFLGLKSPVSDLTSIWSFKNSSVKNLAGWKKKGIAEFEDGTMVKLKFAFYEDAKKNNAYDIADKVVIPTIIVHGDNDTVVPVEQSVQLSKKMKNASLHIVNGADHRYSKPEHKIEMIKTLSQFIINHTKI